MGNSSPPLTITILVVVVSAATWLQLGHGLQGSVVVAKDLETRQLVAIKQVRRWIRNFNIDLPTHRTGNSSRVGRKARRTSLT